MNVRERAKVWQLERAIRAVGKRGMIVSLCLLTLLGTMVTGSFTQVLAGGGTDWTATKVSSEFKYQDGQGDWQTIVSKADIEDKLQVSDQKLQLTIVWDLGGAAPDELTMNDTFTLAPVSFADLTIDFGSVDTSFYLETSEGEKIGEFKLGAYNGDPSTFAVTGVFTGNFEALADPVSGKFVIEFTLNTSGVVSGINWGGAEVEKGLGDDEDNNGSGSVIYPFEYPFNLKTQGKTVFKDLNTYRSSPYVASYISFNMNGQIAADIADNLANGGEHGTVVINDTMGNMGMAPLYLRNAVGSTYEFFDGEDDPDSIAPVLPSRGIFGVDGDLKVTSALGYFRLVNINWGKAWQVLYDIQQKGGPSECYAFGWWNKNSKEWTVGNAIVPPASNYWGINPDVIPETLYFSVCYLLSAIWGNDGNTHIQANSAARLATMPGQDEWMDILSGPDGFITPVDPDYVQSITWTPDGFEIRLDDQAITAGETLFLSYVNEVTEIKSTVRNRVDVRWAGGTDWSNVEKIATGTADSNFNNLTIKKFADGENADTLESELTAMAGTEFKVAIYSADDGGYDADYPELHKIREISSVTIGSGNSVTTASLGSYSKDDDIVITEVTPLGAYEGIPEPIVFHIDPENGDYVIDLDRITNNMDTEIEGGLWFTVGKIAGNARHMLVTVWNKLKGYDPVEVTIEARKNVTGDYAMPANGLPALFSFTLYDDKDQVVQTVKNEDQTITFSVDYIKPGTYTYTLVEEQDNNYGWASDSTEYTVTVVVSKDSENDENLVATVSYLDEGGEELGKDNTGNDIFPVFTNEYDSASGSEPDPRTATTTIEARKDVGDYTIPEDGLPALFNFTLYDEEQEKFLTPVANADQIIAFLLAYTENGTGTHIYTLAEVEGSLPEWTYDTTKYTVKVEVVNDEGDLRVVSVDYYAYDDEDEDLTGESLGLDADENPNLPVFTNTYKSGGGGNYNPPGDDPKPPVYNPGDPTGSGPSGGSSGAIDPNPDVPLGPGVTGDNDDTIVEIDANDDTPLGSGTDLSDENGADEVIDLDASDGAPLGGLPKTGENSPLIWFWSGCGILLLFMAILRVRKLPPTRKDL